MADPLPAAPGTSGYVPTAAEISQAQAASEAAAAQNAAWRNNTAPVLPRMGTPATGQPGSEQDLTRIYIGGDANTPGVARDVTRSEYMAMFGATPEAREEAKRQAAFAPIDYGAMADMPLSLIASRYGEQTASRVQDYYAAHPSARAQAITSQYNAQHGVVENPYDPNTAAGIAFEVGHTGGITTGSLAGKAIGQGYQGDIFAVSGISTVPTRDYSSGMQSGSKLVAALPDETITINTPWGSYVQTPVENAKGLMDYQTGELGVYVKPYGHSQYMLVAGGGRAALQSGMFTFGEAETPYVVSRDKVGTYEMPSGKGMSRLGAEAYAGFVAPLDNRTLTTQDAISRYGNWNNLANYVQQIPAGKAEVKGADIPWSVSPSTPALSYMNDKGIIPGSGVSVYSGEGGLVGSKMGASTPTYGADTTPTSTTPLGEFQQKLTKSPTDVYLSGGLVGEYFFGEKAPEVVKGFVGSVVDFFPSMVRWTPIADSMRVTDPGQTEYLSTMKTKSAEVQSLSEQGKAAYGVDAQGRIKIDTTNPEAVAFQSKYESARTGYADVMKLGVEKGYTKYQGGSLIVNPDLTYDYGEYTKWGVGAGSVVREKLGFNQAQLEAYGVQVEQKKGIEFIPEKIVYGAGYTLSTHPEKIVTAYGAGIATAGIGEVAGVVMQTPRIAAAATAFRAAHPVATVGLQASVPLVLTGATYYGASEGLTATPERTTVNIGKMVPELGGMVYGGATGYLGLRAVDAGYFGFLNKEERPLTGKEALGKKPLEIVDLTADQSWRYSIQQKPFGTVESPTMVGKTRVTESSFTLEEPGNMPSLPGVRPELTSADINPFLQARARGVAGAGEAERASSAKFSFDKLIEDMGLYNQPVSPKTATMREAQRAAWQEPVRVESGILPSDMLPGVNRIGAGLEPMARPNPFAGLADQMGVRIEPATPKGIGKTTDAGFGYGGAPMSSQMLESVVTQSAIKTPTSYRSAMDVVIGQKEAAMRAKPAIEAATRENILPSATKDTFRAPVRLTGFEDVLTGVIESTKRTSSETPAGKAFQYKGVQMDYLRDALKQRKGTFTIEPAKKQPIQKSTQNTQTWFKQRQQSIQRQTPAQTPIQISVQKQIQIQTPVQQQPQVQFPKQTPVQIQPQVQPQLPKQRQAPVQQPQQQPRQQQTPFVSQMQQPAQKITQIQTPGTATTPPTRPVMDPPFAPPPSSPSRSIVNPPFVPTIPIPYKPITPKTPPPSTPTYPDAPVPPIVPGGGLFNWPAGTPGSTPSHRPRRSAFMETFNMGLDISLRGRRTKAAKSFKTPKSKTRAAPKKGGKKK